MASGKIDIRECRHGDAAAIEQVYVDAFPDEDLVPLVKELLEFGAGVISLVAVLENNIVGHVGFTMCRTPGADDDVALLAPLAVSPMCHKQGIGSALVRTGFRHVERAGIGCVFVLGDPGYYGRFGFQPERQVTTPYPLPKEADGAWQSVSLGDSEKAYRGQLIVPELWQRKALW